MSSRTAQLNIQAAVIGLIFSISQYVFSRHSKNKMINYVKEAHTAIFTGPTSCGKTRRVLDLIETEYKHHFDNIVILCVLPCDGTKPTSIDLGSGKMTYVFPLEPKENLLKIIEKLSSLLSGERTLFIVDDVIADETFDKTRGALLDIAISGRHRNHSLWMLTQRLQESFQ